MEAYKNNSKLKILLKVVDVRSSIKGLYEYDSFYHRDLGVLFGLYLSDMITFSSYKRLEALIKKVRENKIFSLR